MSLPRLIVVFLALGALCLVPVVLCAADQPAPAAADPGVIYPRASSVPAEGTPGRSGGYTMVLLVALVMAGAAGWLFWRGRLGPGAAPALRKLAIAETKSLGNRQFLVVASYDDKKFLLGVCPGRIDLLTQLEGAPPAKTP